MTHEFKAFGSRGEYEVRCVNCGEQWVADQPNDGECPAVEPGEVFTEAVLMRGDKEVLRYDVQTATLPPYVQLRRPASRSYGTTHDQYANPGLLDVETFQRTRFKDVKTGAIFYQSDEYSAYRAESRANPVEPGLKWWADQPNNGDCSPASVETARDGSGSAVQSLQQASQVSHSSGDKSAS